MNAVFDFARQLSRVKSPSEFFEMSTANARQARLRLPRAIRPSRGRRAVGGSRSCRLAESNRAALALGAVDQLDVRRTRPSFTILDYVEAHARPDREAIEAVR